jgi:hypothetical protein
VPCLMSFVANVHLPLEISLPHLTSTNDSIFVAELKGLVLTVLLTTAN